MVAKSKIIYFSKETDFSNLVCFCLQSEFNFDILKFDNDKLLKDYMSEKKDFFLILCDGSIPIGQAKEFYCDFCNQRLNIPFFIVGTEDYIQSFRGIGADIFKRDNFIKEVKDKIQKYFIPNPLVKPLDYCPISFSTLTAFEGLECEVYIKLKSGRFLKLFNKNDQVSLEDVSRFSKKGVRELYLNKKTSYWILKQVQMNFKSILQAIEQGEKVQLKEETKSKKTENKEKSFDELLKEIADEKEAKKEKKIQETIDGTFALGEEFKNDINKKIGKAVSVLSKNKNIKKFLDKMKVDRNPNQYFKIHVNLLCKMTCAIAQVMEWKHESTFEKLIYVSYMHDITMVEHPHVARIANLEEFEEIKGELTPGEVQMFYNHPAVIQNMIIDSDDYPVDADKIIYQHHELPNSKGFPNKLQTIRLLPLTCLFIIAHDMVDYIIDNPQWKLEEYIELCKEKFHGAGFTKVIRKLHLLEES